MSSDPAPNLVVVDHPLVQHKLTLMREQGRATNDFRQLLREISQLLAYEATRDLPLTTRAIETPLTSMDAPILAGKKLTLVSILRAGNGLLDGMLDVIPSARVGFVRRRDAAAGPVLPEAPRGHRAAEGHRRRSDAGDGQLGRSGD